MESESGEPHGRRSMAAQLACRRSMPAQFGACGLPDPLSRARRLATESEVSI